MYEPFFTDMMSYSLHTILEDLSKFAPLQLAESWDNVGLLLGDETTQVNRVMTCLTLTPDVADEALDRNAQLIVSHHPILFRPIQKLTTATSEGRMLLKLLRAGVAVYSPHTAFDSARQGVNQQLAQLFDLQDVQPLRLSSLPEFSSLGAGRQGQLPEPLTLHQFLQLARKKLIPKSGVTSHVTPLQYTGNLSRTIRKVGIGCGSAAEFLKDAALAGCDLFLTGEARFHACLEARDRDIALVLAGHYQTERPAVENLAERFSITFPGLEAWASNIETDPVSWSVS